MSYLYSTLQSSLLMDNLSFFVVVFLFSGVASFSHVWISGSILEVSVRAGENITLHCDCEISTGVYVVWYRNCSHENQPSLVLGIQFTAWTFSSDPTSVLKPLPRFSLVKNQSSGSYDLQIINVTGSDEGLYYCGTQHATPLDGHRSHGHGSTYSNMTTRLMLSSDDAGPCRAVHVVPWMMVFIPALTVLSTFLCLILVYRFCPNADNEPRDNQQRCNVRDETTENQDEDVCFTRVVYGLTVNRTRRVVTYKPTADEKC